MEWVAEKNAVKRDIKGFDAKDDAVLQFVVNHITRCTVASQTNERSRQSYAQSKQLYKHETVGKNHGRKQPVCPSCGRTGHTRQQCRACWNCGKVGHRARQCPEPSKSKVD